MHHHSSGSSALLGLITLALASAAAPIQARQPDAAGNTSSAPATLPAIEVSGQADEPTEATRSYTVPSTRASTGLTLSPKETPQSVSVVTRQQMDDQGMQSIGDVLGSTTGITFVELDNGGRTTYRARGFNITNYKVDGLSIIGGSSFNGGGSGAINMDLYDRVSIVRGANGLLGGTGDPSATVDLVRKRPGRALGASLTVRTGSWNKKNAVGDINIPLAADGRIRSRLVFSGENSDGFRDHSSIERQGFLSSFAMDVTDRTQVGLGFQYEHSIYHGASWGANVPAWFADGSPTHFRRSLNLAADWSKSDMEAKTLFASLDHRFDNDWKLRADYAHTSRADLNNKGAVKVNNGKVRWPHWKQDGSGAYLNAIHSETEGETDAFSLDLSGPLELFGRRHELLVGLNGSRMDEPSWTFNSSNCSIDGIAGFKGRCQYRTELPVADWRAWRGDEYGNIRAFRTDARRVTRTTLYGGYVAGRFELADDLTLITGLRRSVYQIHSDNYNAAGVRGARTGENAARAWTPYYGLVYGLTPTYSVYASYTDVFTPQTNKNESGDTLKPITGASYEAGIKGEWFNGALNAAVSAFRSQQKNVALKDGDRLTPDGDQAYRPGTGVTVKGLDAEIAGAVTAAWNVYLGYTYLDVGNKDTAERPDPRHLLRLNTTYRLQGPLRGLTIGGGLTWQGKTVSEPYPGRPDGRGGFDDSPIPLKGYALINAMARYDINRHLSAMLNVSNLFDKTYYRQYGFYNGLIYGEPRRVTLSLQAKF
ncbi:TonB-dependent siderophore receptor [Achromobacter xylosoxidans]|uniref:TonB-dependent siderophore receptor n=1 Tax=Alcaligenes xylosoxydans xylosoxydans TaxID=85698 RepID=UPI0006C5F298|nr:TonB-dependent siderophore receptor [Achromobacter xylosoxidans]CUI87193.1 Outer-membrane receptor for Fe(III)-coprogen%2C Fe(III)-ferrioxamine B and Fe(III)-rhodotrulic acid [Achromobacter xylosoxidans]